MVRALAYSEGPQRGTFKRGNGHLDHACPPSMPMANSTLPSPCLAIQAPREGTQSPRTGTLLYFPPALCSRLWKEPKWQTLTDQTPFFFSYPFPVTYLSMISILFGPC